MTFAGNQLRGLEEFLLGLHKFQVVYWKGKMKQKMLMHRQKETVRED